MRKLILLLMIFIPFCLNAQNTDIQLRYFSEINSLYPRVEGNVPLSKKLSFCGGLSEDALQMITVCGQYSFNWLKAKAGIGYHKQNGLHGIFGLKTKIEWRKFEAEGYINAYVDHKTLYASEVHFLTKLSKFDMGITTDVEYGKFFPLWKNAHYEILKEKLFLVGPIIRYNINKFSIKFFGMFGEGKIGHHPKTFTAKFGLGLIWNTEH